MASILTTAVVSVTTGATQLLASNPGAQLRAISAAANIVIGTAGVLTTSGYPVTPILPFIFPGGDDRHSSVFTGALFAVATATASVTVLEISV